MKGTISVIIAEDDHDLRETLQNGFSRRGLEARGAAGARQALDMLSRGATDAIVMDVRMSEGTGFELIESVCKMGMNKPSLICISGYSDLDPVEAYEMGVDAYFNKPVSCDLLIAATLHFAKKRRLMMDIESRLQSFASYPGTTTQSMKESVVEALELFTALWSYAGVLNETVSAMESRNAQDVRLHWCNKKIEEYCNRLSEELVRLKEGLVRPV